MDIAALISRLPQNLHIPTFLEMRQRTDVLRGSRGAAVRRVGEDRFGEAIELISLGEGPRNILVIGAPHPNEPIGCIAIEWLIHQLRNDEHFRTQGGFRWHFIKAIEPYALKQNEGWFKRPDLATYLEHFYRPAMREQAEYSFSLGAARATGVRTTPENEAYQQALRLTQPDLLVSLHNAENAGAFYFVSRNDKALAEKLSSQPAARGLRLNRLGELGLGGEDAAIAPGVFLLRPTAPGAIRREGIPLVSVTDFLAQNHRRPLELVPEVPLFRDLDAHVHPSGEAVSSDEETGQAVVDLLMPLIDDLAEDATPLEALYVSAIRDCMSSARELGTSAKAMMAQAGPGDALSHRRSAHLFALRPVAMTRRLAEMQSDSSRNLSIRKMANKAQLATRDHLRSSLQGPLFKDAIQAMPLQLVVANQLEAMFTCAAAALEPSRS